MTGSIAPPETVRLNTSASGGTPVSTSRKGRLLLAVLGLALGVTGVARAQTSGEPLRLSAFAVNMSNIATGGAHVIDIRINRWSTPAERAALIETMVSKGPNALLNALQDQKPTGRMNIPGWTGADPHNVRLGWELRYAWQTPDPEGGRRIVIATDRYIGFWEARNQPRSIDYPFTLIEIRMNKDGEGTGKMAVATKISFDKKKNTVELENYASEPVRLNKVTIEK
jgi:hypothetical protein